MMCGEGCIERNVTPVAEFGTTSRADALVGHCPRIAGYDFVAAKRHEKHGEDCPETVAAARRRPLRSRGFYPPPLVMASDRAAACVPAEHGRAKAVAMALGTRHGKDQALAKS